MSDTVEIKDARQARSWRELWQVPTLLAAGVLLIAGAATMVLTKPRPAVGTMIARAEGLIESARPEEALAVLNDEARPHISESFVTVDQRQRFYAARARAIAGGISQLDLREASNHERVITEFKKAEQAGMTLPESDRILLAQSLIELGRFDEAIEEIDRLSDSAAAPRISLRRRIVEVDLLRSGNHDLADAQLLELDADPMLTVQDRVWVIARQTERRLDAGYVDEAVARLLRIMPRISMADSASQGELFLLLGQAYASSGAVGEAKKQLDRAYELIEPGDDLYARVLLARGDVLERAGEPELAREHFEEIVGSYSESPVFLDATLSLAGVLAVLADVDPTLASEDDAVAAYSRVAEEAKFAEAPEAFYEALTESLLARFSEQMVRDELVRADQYAKIAEDLWGISSSPPSVLQAQGRVNRAQAEELLADAAEAAHREVDLADVDPTTRAQAQRWFVRAGDYYRRHADAIAGSDDDTEYANSVWAAAEMFDAGGDTAEAIASYVEFAGSLSDDARLPEAQFRLARAYQATGQYEFAAQQYESLLDVALDPDRGTGVGPFAVLSYVPLAETYLEDADPSNDERASELLSAVLRGDAGGVDSRSFSQALTAMGMVQYYSGAYPRAIESLEEAVARSEDPRRLVRLKFLLADAYRLEAAAISSTLQEGAVAPTVARELEATRVAHIERAIELFAQVREEGGAMAKVRRTSLEEVYLRNAHFYLGDCAFDLGQFEDAIRYYGVAKDAYVEDAASLVALVQIFNAYLEMGDLDRARTASERARRFYEALPESAWDDPTLPMTREDWERWLDSTYKLASLRAASATE